MREISLKNMPNKWKKHLTLVEFGLKKKDDLEHEIKRYNTKDIPSLQVELQKRMQDETTQKAYIISLIPIAGYFKLPNYLVQSVEDIEGIDSFAKNKNNQFSEIWCCEKPRRNGLDNVIGRIAIKTGLSFTNEPEHTIEQVWSVNHREIEKYNSLSKVNYLRASRDGWNRRYSLDHINIENSTDKEILITDFINVVKNIERNREPIEKWIEYLKQIDIPEISIEYMLNGDKFKFIDWDTSNDKKVIDSIFKNNGEWERN